MKTLISQFHTIKRTAATLAAVLVLQTSLSAADMAVRVNVPFDFYVGHTFLPAGEYTVSSKANGKVIQLSGEGGKASAVVSYKTRTTRESSRNVVVFHRYADTNFMAELRVPSDGSTLVVAQSKTERQVRKGGPAIRVATGLNR